MAEPPPEEGNQLASAAFLRWKSRTIKKTNSTGSDSSEEPESLATPHPRVRDRALSDGGGGSISAARQLAEQDFLDIAVPVAWQRFDNSQFDAKVAAAVNMKELLRAVRLKKKTGGLGLNHSNLRASGWTDEDERVVQDNLKTISLCFEDVVALYTKMDKLESFRGGRVLILLDKECRIKDTSHHIFPIVREGADCQPDLFSDEIFESWYKTGEIFKTLIATNPLLHTLAMRFADEETKKMIHKKLNSLPSLKVKPAPAPAATNKDDPDANKLHFGNVVVVELAFALKEDGAFDYCMCGFFDRLGMSLSQLQRTRLLVVLNRLNSDAMRRGIDGQLRRSPTPKIDSTNLIQKSSSGPVLIGGDWNGPPPKQHLACYRIEPRVVSPLLFKILEWLLSDGNITHGYFNQSVKAAMGRVDGYLAMLHEKAMNPMNLGLRALIVPLSKPQ
eukprot:TRINITY_DN228_c0_g1_i1.p1 TRINITY_DN228_c0_g1~~TRINITY_DN228_c0_g1_i1.p1  ORF type:complete len:446 (+),score=71.86 TRINITY_DN228_c0_g1_i1:34-1371(+)